MNELVEDFSINIGKQVTKTSGKPFKSGLKVNTVKKMGIHDITQRPVYYFEEDNTFVEACRCQLLSEFSLEKQKELLDFKSVAKSVQLK